MPPASPPLVSTAMLEGPVAEGAVAVSVMKEAWGQDLSGHQSYCDDVRYVPYVSKGRPTASRDVGRLCLTAARPEPSKLPPGIWRQALLWSASGRQATSAGSIPPPRPTTRAAASSGMAANTLAPDEPVRLGHLVSSLPPPSNAVIGPALWARRGTIRPDPGSRWSPRSRQTPPGPSQLVGVGGEEVRP
jgi:hypothetical protein